MSKKGEKEYLKNLGEDGQKHAQNKPYSDIHCGSLLIDIGSILSILPPPPGKLLDLGVGTGWTSVFFAQRGYEVTGQDISENMILLAEKNKVRSNSDSLKFITCDYENMPFSDVFDCAVFYDSLHHSENAQAAVNAVYRALKPGGILVAIEPAYGHSKREESKRAIQNWDVTEKDMPPSLIVRLGKNAGFCNPKVYVRLRTFEIMPHLSLRGFATACKTFAGFLPWIGMLKANITTMTKKNIAV